MNDWMNEDQTLTVLSKKLKKMESNGLTDTDEYKKLRDDWETLSQNWIEGEILDNDAS